MTIQEAKQKLIRWAEAQIGTREGVNNWNRYAAGMEKLYGWDVQNQPWCDVFVDAGFVAATAHSTTKTRADGFPSRSRATRSFCTSTAASTTPAS